MASGKSGLGLARAGSSWGVGLLAFWAFTLGMSPGSGEAARLSQVLTARDLSRPILLDQNGRQLQLPSTLDPHPLIPTGSTPTYLAFALHGGEDLPAGISSIAASPTDPAGAVGPLDLNRLVKAELDSSLAGSNMAVVATPGRAYLVELLPSYRPGAGAGSSSTAGSLIPGVANPLAAYPNLNHWVSLLAGAATANTYSSANTSTTTNLASTDPVTNWLNSVPTKLLSWTNRGIDQLETLLDLRRNQVLRRERPTANKPSLNLEAQVLGPPPAPIPEPGTWLCFGVVVGGGAIWERIRRRNRTD